MKNKKDFLKVGDNVYYKDDLSKEVYIVYRLYGSRRISLGLLDYPDVEQDYIIDINQVAKVD